MKTSLSFFGFIIVVAIIVMPYEIYINKLKFLIKINKKKKWKKLKII